MPFKRHFYRFAPLFVTFCMTWSSSSYAASLNLPDLPISVDGGKSALVQLVVQRDNNLFRTAYPSYEDLNNDGVIDKGYKPDEIDYFGYFDSDFCYTHNGSYYSATSYAIDKKCTTDTTTWSGDFLNYASMSRMDITLRALYGGKRVIDTNSQTVLRRAFIPWTFHSWGFEYESESVDGYKISDYSALSEPSSGTRHHIITNNYDRAQDNLTDTPYLRIRTNTNARIWDWIDTANVQGKGVANHEIILDVEVCAGTYLDDTCALYPDGNYKPTGLLHTYGENDSMYFSLLTGSFENNRRGGVLRSSMKSFTNEINEDNGTFNSTDGIVQTLNAIQIPNDFLRGVGVMADCGWIGTRKFVNGECRAWGNPIAEMMYEGMRYFSGAAAPTAMFHDDAAAASSLDSQLGLPAATWDDPYSSNQPWGQCASAHQLVISDPSPSFDGDQLPGSSFSTFTSNTLGTLDVGAIADDISNNDSEVKGLKLIGETGTDTDQAPSAKTVETLKTSRGPAPGATHREGSYYASSVAYYGHQNDIHPSLAGKQTVSNYTLALGSPLPTIEVDVAGQTIRISPYGRSLHDYCGNFINVIRNTFVPTNALVRFVVEDVSDTSGSFRVSIENMEQGGNNDNDANIRYIYNVVGNELELTVDSFDASGCVVQHLGYSISGTTADGIYLDVRNRETTTSRDVDFLLDTPPGELPGTDNWNDGAALPLLSTRTFTPSQTPAAEPLKSPLWFAAKWGGFNDSDGDGKPNITSEWDADNDGDPDNYFRVTNPSLMVETLGDVFESIAQVTGSIASTSVSSTALNEDSRIFESSFNSDGWHSEVSSRAISGDGTLAEDVDWSVTTRLTQRIANDSRTILTYKPSTGTGVAFQWPDNEQAPTSAELDPSQMAALSTDPVSGAADDLGSDRVDYLRGDAISGFRQRISPLGDIVNSSVQFVGPPDNTYPDNWGEGEPESAAAYSTFRANNAKRKKVIYVGANDGMLHAFNAGSYTENVGYDIGNGDEIFAYVPARVYDELPELGNENYAHKFYVDAHPAAADVFINNQWRTVLIGGLGKGGQGIYALDITNPGSVSEEQANATVLWEFTDEHDAHLGYTYTSPLITRMHNGKWVAIFGNGYNADEADEHRAPDGLASIFIVDIQTGELIKKLHSAIGTTNASANAFNAPTAVDLDNDNIVDVIYVGDIHGVISKFNVSSSDVDDWARVGDQVFATVPRDETAIHGELMSITSKIAIGRHPTGDGVMLFFSSGRYLEPVDLTPSTDLHRLYGIWDPDPYADADLREHFLNDELREQSILSEQTIDLDTDADGTNDATANVRTSSQRSINWDTHHGWFMDLEFQTRTGEQVVVEPLLRESFIVFSTYIATGDICTPSSSGWLMVLDAASGAMPTTSVDLNGDGNFSPNEEIAGVSSAVNPFSAPTIAAGTHEDVLISSNTDGSGASSALLNSTRLGRASWRELKP